MGAANRTDSSLSRSPRWNHPGSRLSAPARLAARDPAGALHPQPSLGDLAERVSRLETTLLSERDDYKRRLDYALGELRRRDEVQRRPRWWWFRGKVSGREA